MSFQDRQSSHVVVHDDGSVTTIPKYNGTLSVVELPGGLTAGDLLYYDGASLDRIPIGTEGQVLTVVGGVPAWADLPFDPTTLPLEGWWRTNYGGSPWVGEASTGGSSGRDLSEATNPPSVGSAINGLDPADFDGTNDNLDGPDSDDVWTDAAGMIAVLFYADAAASDAGASLAYTIPALVTHTNGGVYLTFSTSGVRLGGSVTVTHDSVAVAASTGAWHLAIGTWNGSTLYLSVDGGAFSTKAHGVTTATNPIVIGTNYDGSARFNGRIAEIMVAKFTADASDVSDIVNYINNRYGTAF